MDSQWEEILADVTLSLLLLPEWVFDGNVAIHSYCHETEDGALSKHEDETSDEEATVEVGTETGADKKKVRERTENTERFLLLTACPWGDYWVSIGPKRNDTL